MGEGETAGVSDGVLRNPGLAPGRGRVTAHGCVFEVGQELGRMWL